MNMKKLACLLFATALLFSACKKEDEKQGEDTPVAPTEDPIPPTPPTPPVPDNVFVSVEPQNSNVLIEELTGTGCQYCPLAHKLCDELVAANPGKIFAYCIHSGSYAAGRTPLYTTADGDSVSILGVMAGYPSGYINRYQWNLNINGQQKTGWGVPKEAFQQFSTAIVNGQAAKSNVAARASINKSTRELKITAQVCFTRELAATDKYALCVSLTQNNIKGPQSAGATYYPARWDSTANLYTHNHMLRAMIGGHKGVELEYKGTGANNVIEKTFTYTIPEKMGNGNIPAVLEDMEVYCYVSRLVQLTNNNTGYSFYFPLPIDNVCKAELKFE